GRDREQRVGGSAAHSLLVLGRAALFFFFFFGGLVVLPALGRLDLGGGGREIVVGEGGALVELALFLVVGRLGPAFLVLAARLLVERFGVGLEVLDLARPPLLL